MAITGISDCTRQMPASKLTPSLAGHGEKVSKKTVRLSCPFTAWGAKVPHHATTDTQRPLLTSGIPGEMDPNPAFKFTVLQEAVEGIQVGKPNRREVAATIMRAMAMVMVTVMVATVTVEMTVMVGVMMMMMMVANIC